MERTASTHLSCQSDDPLGVCKSLPQTRRLVCRRGRPQVRLCSYGQFRTTADQPFPGTAPNVQTRIAAIND